MQFVSVVAKLVRQPFCWVRPLFGGTVVTAESSVQTAPLRLKYEPQYDLLSVWLNGPEPVDNIEVEPGVCLRVSRAHGGVIGLEMIEAAARLHKHPNVFKSASFAKNLIARYVRKADLADLLPAR